MMTSDSLESVVHVVVVRMKFKYTDPKSKLNGALAYLFCRAKLSECDKYHIRSDSMDCNVV